MKKRNLPGVLRRQWIQTGLFAVLWMVTGCSATPPFPVKPPEALPETFRAGQVASGEKQETNPWWENFQRPEVNRLMEEALAKNFDIRTMRSRLGQADALLATRNAALRPTLGATAEMGHSRSRNGDSGVTTGTERYRMDLAAGYEVDLWGRLGAMRASAGAAYRAGAADLEAAAMTVSATLAEAWVRRVLAIARLDLVQAQAETETTRLRMQEKRFSFGLATALDVLQQREAVAQIRAQIPELNANILLEEHVLALLTGQAVTRMELDRDGTLPVPGPVPETGLPADLLAARPDIRAAGERLMAARWDTRAAQADRLPQLHLKGTAGLTAAGIRGLTESWLLDLAANLTAPLIDGGRRKAAVDLASAMADEKWIAYEKAVFTAIREVEDALVREAQVTAVLQETEAQLAAARATRKEARRRYLQGDDNFDVVLSAGNRVRSLEQTRLTHLADHLRYRIALYRALGGDWTGRIVETGDMR